MLGLQYVNTSTICHIIDSSLLAVDNGLAGKYMYIIIVIICFKIK